MRAISIAAALIVVVCSPSLAETLEIPLAGMSGGLGSYQARVAYTGESKHVSSVSFRVVASIEQLGRVFCIHAPGVPEELWGWCTYGPSLRGKIWKNQDTWNGGFDLRGLIIQQAGDYNSQLNLEPAPGFDELNAGDVLHIRFTFEEGWWCCHPAYPSCIEDTLGSLTGVTLLIEISDAVPVEKTTWGRIKNLYGE